MALLQRLTYVPEESDSVHKWLPGSISMDLLCLSGGPSCFPPSAHSQQSGGLAIGISDASYYQPFQLGDVNCHNNMCLRLCWVLKQFLRRFFYNLALKHKLTEYHERQ